MERAARTLPASRVGDPQRLNEALDRLVAMAVVKRVECDEKKGRVIAWAL